MGKKRHGGLNPRSGGGRPAFRSQVQAEAYVNKLKANALKQFDETRGDYIETIIETVLLDLHRSEGWGLTRLQRFYRNMIRLRVEGINACRSGGDYEVMETAYNAEDYGFREELRKIGVDVQKWESEVAYVIENGVRRVTFPGEDGYDEDKRKEAEEA